MDNNDISISKIPRKTYSRELLRSLQNSELSTLWPKSLDKTCVNSHNQWDPVKSFENSKTTDNKKNIFPENKPGYRNNDKSKDDISLRPERRRWNDGCQVSNNKRNSDDIHSTSYRKSYQSTIPNCGGGDYDRNRFNRNVTRNNKSKDIENNRENKINSTNTTKIEKSSRNNSNLEERKDEKEDQKINLKNGNNSRFHRNSEPEWFIDGPENCEETIELRGINVNDNEMMNFKACSSKSEETIKQSENLLLNLPLENSVLVENCVSPKREGSRFQDIFLKEKKINHLNESKDVENILKAVLSDNVSKSDAERLNNVSKPLPNGVLTLEEIEKNMTSGTIQLDRAMTTKSTTIDALNSFEPRLNTLLSSGMSSPSKDNSKVVNWLSGLNLHISKDQPEIDKKIQKYSDTNNFITNQQMPISTNFSKFTPSLQPPPGLPLVLNNNSLQHQHQQQTQQQLLQHQQQMHQNKLLLMKMQMSTQPNVMNHGLTQRNILPYMFQHQQQLQQQQQHHHPPNEFENLLGGNDNYRPNNGPPSSEIHIDQNMLSNYLMKHKVSPPISQLMSPDGRNHHQMLSMNGPPGLTNMSTMLEHKNMIMPPRPIVKTSSPQMYDISGMTSDFHHKPPNFHNNTINTNNNITNSNNNFQYHRSMSANNPIEMHKIFNRCPSLIETGSSPHSHHMVQEANPLDLYSSMRTRDLFQKQSMLFNSTGYPARQSFIPSAHEISLQSPSGAASATSNKILANLFNVGASSTLPPLPQQAKYADQIETENI